MDPTICSAIESRSVISFYYNGGMRTVEPFCHGGGRRGQDLLRGYQIEGYSESGNAVGWKLFRTDQMADVSETGHRFNGNRPEYEPYDSAMSVIHCNI